MFVKGFMGWRSAFVLLIIVLGSVNCLAADFVVTTAADSGPGTLREAVNQANLSHGPDSILIEESVDTIVLLSGAIEISAPLTITGRSSRSTIDGNQVAQIFRIPSGAGQVSIYNLVLRNGRATGLPDSLCESDSAMGGAICSVADLEIVDSVFELNASVESGGALFVQDASLVIRASLFRENAAGGHGGAINHVSSTFDPQSLSSLVISESTFDSNIASSDGSLRGGALRFAGQELDIENTAFIGNEAVSLSSSSAGGGASIFTAIGRLNNGSFLSNRAVGTNSRGGGLDIVNGERFSVADSSFSGNEATIGGGLRASNPNEFWLINSTVSNNQASLRSGGVELIDVDFGFIYNSTITENSADNPESAQGLSAGCSIFTSSGVRCEVALSSSIVSGNSSTGPDWEVADTSYSYQAARPRYSLLGSGVGFMSSGPGNVFESNPRLDPLQDNGCAVPAGFPETADCVSTHLTGSGSSAIGSGQNDLALDFDQRGVGFPRAFFSRPSIGATDTISGDLLNTIPVPLLQDRLMMIFFILTVAGLALPALSRSK